MPSPKGPIPVLLGVSQPRILVAGLPPALRTVHHLAQDPASFGPILLHAASPDFPRRWRATLKQTPQARVVLPPGNGDPRTAGGISLQNPIVVLAPDGIPDVSHLRRFLEQSQAEIQPSSWIWKERVIAIFYPKAEGPLLGNAGGVPSFSESVGELPRVGGRRVLAPPDAWRPIRKPEEIREMELELLRDLPQETDGYLARYDRFLSIGLSRWLVRTPITPNQITTISLLIGLTGAWLLSSLQYASQLWGAILLWVCCVLDGCDGEVARLKYLTSHWGGRYDLVADNIVHLAIFLAITLHLSRARPDISWGWPAAVMMAGVLLSMWVVWRLVLRKPASARIRILERIASRDFIYLVFLLTAIRRLEWFLWGTALGSHLFWLGAWRMARRSTPA